MNALVLSLASGLIGAVVAVLIQSYIGRRRDRRTAKRDVLRRFAGNRHVLTGVGSAIQPNGEPFVALNEALVVFAGDMEVIEALRTMHAELGQPGRLPENIVTLVKRMAVAADVPITLNDSFIERPFAPSSSAGQRALAQHHGSD